MKVGNPPNHPSWEAYSRNRKSEKYKNCCIGSALTPNDDIQKKNAREKFLTPQKINYVISSQLPSDDNCSQIHSFALSAVKFWDMPCIDGPQLFHPRNRTGSALIGLENIGQKKGHHGVFSAGTHRRHKWTVPTGLHGDFRYEMTPHLSIWVQIWRK